MKFKHTFHVFVDNFSVIYKQLLYRLVLFVIAAVIGISVLAPFIIEFVNSEALNSLITGIKTFTLDLLDGEVELLATASESIVVAFDQVLHLLQTKVTEIILMGLLIIALYIVERWFEGLGNYTTAVIINDKMALRTKSAFLRTLISHFKEAALYNLIYVPLSIVYDLIIAIALLTILFFMMKGIQFFLVSLFIFALIMILAIAFKMTLTCDWLPALIRGKLGQKKAIAYTFSRKNKDTINTFSNFVVLIIIIIAINMIGLLFTFGVGLLLTLPSSFVMILCFEMVVYYDREELRYFLDNETIIKPDKERVITREQFFKGTDYDEEP